VSSWAAARRCAQANAGVDGPPHALHGLEQERVALRARDAEVVHRRAQPLEQQGAAIHVGIEQSDAAVAVGEAEDGRLEFELRAVTRRRELEHGGDAVRRRRLDDERVHAETVERGSDGEGPLRRHVAHQVGQRVEPVRLARGGSGFAQRGRDVDRHADRCSSCRSRRPLNCRRSARSRT
jgi:hypothetical protein